MPNFLVAGLPPRCGASDALRQSRLFQGDGLDAGVPGIGALTAVKRGGRNGGMFVMRLGRHASGEVLPLVRRERQRGPGAGSSHTHL